VPFLKQKKNHEEADPEDENNRTSIIERTVTTIIGTTSGKESH